MTKNAHIQSGLNSKAAFDKSRRPFEHDDNRSKSDPNTKYKIHKHWVQIGIRIHTCPVSPANRIHTRDWMSYPNHNLLCLCSSVLLRRTLSSNIAVGAWASKAGTHSPPPPVKPGRMSPKLFGLALGFYMFFFASVGNRWKISVQIVSEMSNCQAFLGNAQRNCRQGTSAVN